MENVNLGVNIQGMAMALYGFALERENRLVLACFRDDHRRSDGDIAGVFDECKPVAPAWHMGVFPSAEADFYFLETVSHGQREGGEAHRGMGSERIERIRIGVGDGA